MEHLATIRNKKDLGNESVYIKARNRDLQYWDFTNTEWVEIEDNLGVLLPLVEYPDSDPVESRYAATIELPQLYDIILEYVEMPVGNVIGEESINKRETEIIDLVTLIRKIQTNKAWMSADSRSVFIFDDNGADVISAFTISVDGKSRTPIEVSVAQELYNSMVG